MEVTRTPTAAHLSQSKYIMDLFRCTKMTDCKPTSIPAPAGRRLSLHEREPLSDVTEFRSIVGALQYLIFAHPDIAFAVNQVCQYMHSLTTTHQAVVKHIIQYLKATHARGLVYTVSPLTITARYHGGARYCGTGRGVSPSNHGVAFNQLGSNPRNNNNPRLTAGIVERSNFGERNTCGGEKIVCQICGKPGHLAFDCYQRMNAVIEGRIPAKRLTAMASSPMTLNRQHNVSWLFDTGANAHITPDLQIW